MRTTRVLVVTTAALVALAAAVASAQPTDPGEVSTGAVRLQPPSRTFTVAAVGDFLSEGLVNNAAAGWAPAGTRYDYEPLLRPVGPILRAADLAICHMETPIGAPGATVGFAGKSNYGTNLILAAAELPADLVRLGFDRCSTASNHANDAGVDGIRTTLEALDGAGLGHAGTARSPAEAAPQLISVSGVQVSHLAFARNSNTGFPADWWRLRQGVTAANVIDDVAVARAAGAEVVIVSLHVYVEMQNAPTGDDRALVQQITSQAHPDLVIIHGPHVVQPVERVNGTLVYWSLGNFISGMGVSGRDKYSDPRTLDGLLASVPRERRLEIMRDLPETGAILVPVGGGGLASGTGIAAKGVNPRVRAIGVQSEASAAMSAALAAGQLVTVANEETLADGLAGNIAAGSITFPLVRDHLDEVVTVPERAIGAAMRTFMDRHHLIVEGSGAVGLALLQHDRSRALPEPIVLIVSGSNIATAVLKRVLSEGTI